MINDNTNNNISLLSSCLNQLSTHVVFRNNVNSIG